ncbi:bifunctional hydroxymethylpyrimidine kinase/phosphomethylpyrimidine kinase [Devriesea agamarum]|uniref:bifunctional hydroxymethylpyrimidine kinase/phosphomethylpyrimidine kinase n=1 Tax=Devriesea agamarum TaxID=472569 RepID=UPI00071D38E2|nr:bifunctional hydroxymethylpyrimidine kinase/phosphomethylpyrimidine kinase [Devriesea agamarum]
MRPPIALSIAGSDPSGGAGIQADLKTFTALGVYGMAAVTALTAQNTQGVHGVHAIHADFVEAQVTSVLDDMPVDATKIGMLANAEIVNRLGDLFSTRRDELGVVVLDPVMISSSGAPLLTEEASRVVIERLLPLTDVLTPNIVEAAFLLGADMACDAEEMREQAQRLRELGPRCVLLKGGHLRGHDSIDVFVDGAGQVELLRGRMLKTRNTHGTGCTLSSAIAAQYARMAAYARQEDAQGADDRMVVASAREFLADAIENAVDWEISRAPETGHGPVNHLITVGGAVSRRGDDADVR